MNFNYHDLLRYNFNFLTHKVNKNCLIRPISNL